MSDAGNTAFAPQAPVADAATAAFKGFVDGLNAQWRIVGWVQLLNAAEPDRLQVHLAENAAVLDTGIADVFRGDLVDAKIGDGRFGFSLRIPPRLFDGSRHKLAVHLPELHGNPVLGELDVSLPHRALRQDPAGGAQTGADVLRSVLTHRVNTGDYNPDVEANALTEVLDRIAQAYDPATALGCLYIHVLRRRIDADGLQTRLTRLSRSPEELHSVVREVLASDEACNLYRPDSEGRFPHIKALESWTKLRRST